MMYMIGAIGALLMVVALFLLKKPDKKTKRKKCPTCSKEGRCTQECKRKLGDYY